MKMIDSRDLCREIGYHYFNAFGAMTDDKIDQCRGARAAIESLRITAVEFDGTNIVITTGRPGLLIGRKGADIDALTKTLRKSFEFGEIKIKEDRILEDLFCFECVYDYNEFCE